MCGALPVSTPLDPALFETQTVIRGYVTKGGSPVSVGYARLHDSSGEFVAEVPLNADGEFRFFARPATWTVKLLVAGAAEAQTVEAVAGDNEPLTFSL